MKITDFTVIEVVLFFFFIMTWESAQYKFQNLRWLKRITFSLLDTATAFGCFYFGALIHNWFTQ